MNFSWLPIAQAQANSSREIVDKLARTPLSQIVIFVTVLTVLRLAIFPYLKNTKPHLRGTPFALGRFANEMLDAFIYAGVFVFMLIRPFAVQAFLIPSGSMWPELYVNSFIVANKAVYRYSDPKVGDIVVFHPPKEGAIAPTDLDSDGEMKFDFIKRCIGTPGDLIEIKKGVLYRNGQKIDEKYVAYSKCLDPDQNCTEFSALSADDRQQLVLPSFKLVKYKNEIIPLNYDDDTANAPKSAFPRYSVADKFVIPNLAEEKVAMNLPAEKLPPDHYLFMGDNRNNSFDGRGWGMVERFRIVGRAEFVWWPLPQLHRTR